MRILALDWGERRLGFAVSDPTCSFALPLCTVEIKSESEAVERVGGLCEEQGADRLVVGMPVNMDGTIGYMAEKVESFIETLRESLSIEIETYDERLSSSMAERAMIEADLSPAKRKSARDKLAAQIILQSYLERMGNL